MQTSGQAYATVRTKGPSLTLIRGAIFFIIIVAHILVPEQFTISKLISQALGRGTTQVSQSIEYTATLAIAAVSLWLADLIGGIISRRLQGIPGPLLAKLTTGWKLVQIRNRTYTKKLRELHHRHGAIVQVGPQEYSVLNPQLVEQCHKVHPLSTLPLKTLPLTLKMANIFHYEPGIDECNQKLLRTLTEYAQSGEEADVTDLIACYAYDVLFTTTTGASPGFLDRIQDTSTLISSMESWKFYALLTGSYLRLHRLIDRTVRVFSGGKNLNSLISKYIDINPVDGKPSIINEMRHAAGEMPIQRENIIEVCIAMLVSGSDPAIAHILASLFFTFQDADLVETLRREVRSANLSEPPKIKELIHAKPRMPVLFAVLEESLRLIQPRTNGLSYVSPTGGVTIAGRHVPEGCTVCLEPSVSQVNPDIFGSSAEAFDPTRWLEDPAVARGFRNHMIAFGAGTDLCPGQELHLSVVAKVVTQVISSFDFEMASSSVLTSPVAMTFEGAGGKLRFQAIVKIPKDCKLVVADIQSPLRATAAAFAPETTTAPEFPPGLTPKKSAGTTNGAPGVSCDTSSVSPTLSVATTAKSSDVSATAVTWADEYALEEIIGRKTTNELLNHLDPTLTTIPRGLLKTCAITNPRDRYRMHELIERIWGGRLIHQTSRKDSCMYIWAPGSKVPKWLQQLHMHRARNVRETSTAGKAAPNKTTTPAEAKPAPVKVERPVHAVWTNFAKDENTRYGKVAAMSAAECGNARSSQEAEQDGEKKADGQDGKYLFKETFKQTASAATNGALGESRTELGTETTHHTKDGSTTVVDNATESKNALPPHLRARTVSPPHLRAKSITVDNTAEVAESNTKDTDTTTNEGVWVAARLPTPCSPN